MTARMKEKDMTLRNKLLALGGAAVLIAAGSVGAITMASAQTPAAGAKAAQRQQVRDDFLGKFAANLNTTVDQLTTAGKAAASATVDDLVSQGRLTQDQATKIKDRIASGKGFGLGRLGTRGDGEHRENVRKLLGSSAAKALGIDGKELKTDLKNGQSIAEIAAQKNIDLNTVKAQITADAKAALDKAIQNGKIDQAKEDAALQKLAAKLDDILNKKK